MATPEERDPSIDPKSGFCSKTLIYFSLRPGVTLPPETQPLSISHYTFSLLHSSPPPPSSALIDVATSRRISYPDLTSRVKSLASFLRNHLKLSRHDVAFVLSPNSLHIPVLYLALFSLGVVVSPSNPTNTAREISRQISLCKPVVAFAVSGTTRKIPPLRHGTILLDSCDFERMMAAEDKEFPRVEVSQKDTALILYSSGTTGRVKGVELTHRNLTASVAMSKKSQSVSFCTVPLFHVYGIGYMIRSVAMGHSLLVMERFDFRGMLRAIGEFNVSHLAVAPPVVGAMVKEGATDGCDLRSLETVGCGGAPLPMVVIERFGKQFPLVQLAQAYGLTESTGRIFTTVGREESLVEGATGRLMPNCQAKIVDPDTAIPLPPQRTGELWLRGPLIMKGYLDDKEANAASLTSDKWLRTGDLCYINSEGFLFYVDRIKDLIKYKGYQIAPAELEELLQSHPDIADVAVAPYPDEEAHQVPLAFVVRRFGTFTNESQIKDFIAKQVAPYKKVRKIIFVSTVPKNAAGKVLRKELLNKYAYPNATSRL